MVIKQITNPMVWRTVMRYVSGQWQVGNSFIIWACVFTHRLLHSQCTDLGFSPYPTSTARLPYIVEYVLVNTYRGLNVNTYGTDTVDSVNAVKPPVRYVCVWCKVRNCKCWCFFYFIYEMIQAVTNSTSLILGLMKLLIFPMPGLQYWVNK